jgi:hypothetical protein
MQAEIPVVVRNVSVLKPPGTAGSARQFIAARLNVDRGHVTIGFNSEAEVAMARPSRREQRFGVGQAIKRSPTASMAGVSGLVVACAHGVRLDNRKVRNVSDLKRCPGKCPCDHAGPKVGNWSRTANRRDRTFHPLACICTDSKHLPAPAN